MTKHHLTALLAGLSFQLAGAVVWAQEYPAKVIRIIVPFAPGASTDTLARAVAQRLTEAWSQQVIVENRPGAAGMTATAMVAKSPPDGYTLQMATTSTHNITPHVYKSVPYDALKDFAPISLVAWVPNVLTVHPSLPVKTVREFIVFSKARPGQLLFSSSGTGTTLHLAGELFKSMAKVDIVHVPYKGAAPALIDLVGGQVQCAFTTVSASLPFIKENRLRPLGVTTLKRSALFPELPTIAEAALPGYEMPNWVGLVAPAQTPSAVVQKLNAEIGKWMSLPETKQRMIALGADGDGGPSAGFADTIAKGYVSLGKVIKAAGVQSE